MLKGLDTLIRSRVELPVYVAEDPLTAVRDSQSYPGLTTFYTVFTVEAAVPDLPTTDFQTEENSPTDPVRAHYWKWLPEAEARRLF